MRSGNKRQFDLLTFDTASKRYYHVEVSATLKLNFYVSLSNIAENVESKFFGMPKNKRPDNPNTDFAKGKTYEQAIKTEYQRLGIDFEKVTRVCCTWCLNGDDKLLLPQWKKTLAEKHHLRPKNFEVLEFRDEVLKHLLDTIGTAHYDDELLRTISFIAAYRNQLTV